MNKLTREQCDHQVRAFESHFRERGYKFVRTSRFILAYDSSMSGQDRETLARMGETDYRERLPEIARRVRGSFALIHAVPGKALEYYQYSAIHEHGGDFETKLKQTLGTEGYFRWEYSPGLFRQVKWIETGKDFR